MNIVRLYMHANIISHVFQRWFLDYSLVLNQSAPCFVEGTTVQCWHTLS